MGFGLLTVMREGDADSDAYGMGNLMDQGIVGMGMAARMVLDVMWGGVVTVMGMGMC